MKQEERSTKEVFSAFLLSCEARGVQRKTLNTYEQHFHAIAKRLNTEEKIADLTEKDLEKMISSMRQENLRDQSISSYTRTLKVFFSWCNEQGISPLNLSIFKAPEAVKETYSDEELLRLIRKPSMDCGFCEYRNWVIVNFLINSGCRASTLRNIQIRDVDLNCGQIISRHNKNGKINIIPLCDQMVSILKEYLGIRKGEGSDFLFCNESGEKLGESGLRQAIVKYNDERGVKNTSLHSFRHSFAKKYLLDCGGDAFTLQKLLGHSTLKMTKHYCTIFDKEIVNNFNQHSPLTQLQNERR